MIADSASNIPEYALVVSEKGGHERRESFRAPELTVGRVQGNDLVLPKGNVSKRHARILYREGRFIVTDLNSTNGTYVNRRRIAQATIIREGDKIYIGDFVIQVEPSEGAATPDPSTPSAMPDILSQPPPDHEYTANNAVLPGWERPSSVPDDFSRTSSGPPPRYTDSPVHQESSHGSQRFSDMAGGHRKAVAQVVHKVIERLGEPDLHPSEDYQGQVREQVGQVADQLLVEGQVPVGTSAEAIADHALMELLETGPLGELLDDPAVSSISASRSDELVGTRDGRQQTFPPGFSCLLTYQLALRRLCDRAGASWEEERVTDCSLPGGAVLSLIRGDVAASGPLLLIQKPRKIASTLDDLVRRGAISRAIATFLGQCVAARLNILVLGPRDEGANVLLSALCAAAPRERVIAASDFDDVMGDDEHAVRLDLSQYQGQARRLLEIASSISHARLAITLTSTSLAVATLEAMGSGANGILASMGASNLDRGLQRLTADIVAERPGMTLQAASGWVLGSFDLAVEMARLRDGRIRALRVAELVADGTGGVRGHDVFRFSVSRVAAGGAVEGNFAATGEVPRLAGQLQALGLRMDNSLFSRPPSR